MKKSKKSIKELVKPLDQNEQILQPARKALAGPAASDMQRPRRAAFGDITNVPTELGVEDVDRENKDDVTLVALYAHDIFNYYKEREAKFIIQPYLSIQPALSETMRAILVDWLVELQENFELNHETLYLAVKLLDTYCSLVPNIRDQIQLIGAAALFVACKFDERVPPPVEDFLYVCDDTYTKNEFLAMERTVLKAVNFELGRPISYRFLRRYAMCARSPIQTLTLARYLLELSLMEYCFVSYRESLLAAASLYIARRMRNEGGWTATLQFYTEYTLADLRPTVLELNPLLKSNKRPDLKTVRAKYNHPVFHSVGSIPPLSNTELFPQEGSQ
ncbi:LOW QUALITY PROTEIN: G2/mitotic-specific cyclin-B3-like [Pomacea canaliculata]|uniref:LOW QUALITY PROTEIN: G2/mitotic-specific cyclin-B3-like n=1 Tax=Pomacea canaliculata TaxID=400727 RepID=UPI000D72D32D|nr:LOW QUALITY PROTEIN: G2/mitotic-specific cyclin-B3-like [Pomacea canaliculata]